MTSEEVVKKAFEAFDQWCRRFDPDGNYDVLELAEIYARLQGDPIRSTTDKDV